MGFIKKIRYYCWKKKMLDIHAKRRVERRMMDIENAKNIGIYAVYKDTEHLKWLNQLVENFKSQGSSVRVLLYTHEKQKPQKLLENSYLGLFSKSEIGCCYLPKVNENPYLLSFLEQPFDILFDFSMQFHYQDVFVLLSSKASLVIGKGGEWSTKVNDLSFFPTEAMDVPDFYTMIQNFYKNIQFNER